MLNYTKGKIFQSLTVSPSDILYNILIDLFLKYVPVCFYAEARSRCQISWRWWYRQLWHTGHEWSSWLSYRLSLYLFFNYALDLHNDCFILETFLNIFFCD